MNPARILIVEDEPEIADNLAALLTAKGRGPVTASRPDFVFETSCAPYEALAERVKN